MIARCTPQSVCRSRSFLPLRRGGAGDARLRRFRHDAMQERLSGPHGRDADHARLDEVHADEVRVDGHADVYLRRRAQGGVEIVGTLAHDLSGHRLDWQERRPRAQGIDHGQDLLNGVPARFLSVFSLAMSAAFAPDSGVKRCPVPFRWTALPPALAIAFFTSGLILGEPRPRFLPVFFVTRYSIADALVGGS